MHALFANDCLISILVPFVGRIDGRIAALVDEVGMPSPLPIQHGQPSPLPDALIDGFCVDMTREIQQARDAAVTAHRGLSSDVIAEFAYLLAAFVDEILISTFNDRLPRRFNGMVENMLFGTMDAGEQLFVRMDRVIERRSQIDAALAGAYLLVLSLGFRGQYSASGAGEALARYHDRLSPLALAAGGEHGSRRPVFATIDQDAATRATPTDRQLLLLRTLIATIWLTAIVGMEVSWHTVTAPIRKAVAELRVAEAAIHAGLPGDGR